MGPSQTWWRTGNGSWGGKNLKDLVRLEEEGGGQEERIGKMRILSLGGRWSCYLGGEMLEKRKVWTGREREGVEEINFGHFCTWHSEFWARLCRFRVINAQVLDKTWTHSGRHVRWEEKRVRTMPWRTPGFKRYEIRSSLQWRRQGCSLKDKN